MTSMIMKYTFISLHITAPSPVTANSDSQRLWMMYEFLLIRSYVSLQTLRPLNGHLRHVQRRLILLSGIFRNGRNVDYLKTENTLVTYVETTLLLFPHILYILILLYCCNSHIRWKVFLNIFMTTID